MSLITVIKVSLRFVEREIFQEIGFQINAGERIGIVGPNGTGKTTLLKLIKGEIEPDSGEIRVSKGVRVGYLPQDVQETNSGPILQSVVNSVPGRLELDSEITKTTQSLRETRNKHLQDTLAHRLAEIHQEVQRLEQQFPVHEAEKILVGLGFSPAEFPAPVASLSGGWKMRAALASLLYQKPDLLLLDEPTNHLDIPSIRWLEQFLQGFRGALVLVSHDKDFLNRQIRRTISFEPEGIKFYSGNYDFYLKVREEEEKTLRAKARNQEKKIKDAEKFIEKFKAKASKARQAQSKIKLVKKIELVETRKREKTIHFSLPEVTRSSREVVSIRGLSKGFGDTQLYQDVDLTVLRGERIAIIGRNGCGKTTLLRMLAGEIPPDKGNISFGHGVKMGYFAQHHSDMLNPGNTVIQEVCRVVPNQTVSFVRGICGAFLFSGDEVDKPVDVLSGGERARVSLAKLLARPGNLMVMDEPSNHLDIASSEALIDALAEYKGTLIFVSHNQSFINRLATKIWDIRNREIIEYPGNLDEYCDHLALEEFEPCETVPVKAPSSEDQRKTEKTRRQDRKEKAEKRRMITETLKPIQNTLDKIEAGISELEARQAELEKLLADVKVFRDKDKSIPLLNEYRDVREELDDLLAAWEKQQVELESTKKDLGV